MTKQNQLILDTTNDLLSLEAKRDDFFKKYKWGINKSGDDLILDNYVTYLRLKDECGLLMNDLIKATKAESEYIEGKLKAKLIRGRGIAFKMGVV